MGHHQDGVTFLVEFGQQVHDDPAIITIQIAGRLVG